MNRSEIISVIDEEIDRLERVRGLLRNTRDLLPAYERVLSEQARKQTSTPRRMSPEGRRRIAEAQKKRWAKQKRQQNATKR